MADEYGDLLAYHDPTFSLTIDGRPYVIPPASAAVGLWCRTVAHFGQQAATAKTDEDLAAAGARASARVATMPPFPGEQEHLSFEEQMLGSAFALMAGDEVPDEHVLIAARTVFIRIAYGDDAAIRFWQAGGRPEALRPAPTNRADRRAQARRTASDSPTTSTAVAATTPPRGSGSGTRSRKGSRRHGAGSRSPGPGS